MLALFHTSIFHAVSENQSILETSVFDDLKRRIDNPTPEVKCMTSLLCDVHSLEELLIISAGIKANCRIFWSF